MSDFIQHSDLKLALCKFIKITAFNLLNMYLLSSKKSHYEWRTVMVGWAFLLCPRGIGSRLRCLCVFAGLPDLAVAGAEGTGGSGGAG